MLLSVHHARALHSSWTNALRETLAWPMLQKGRIQVLFAGLRDSSELPYRTRHPSAAGEHPCSSDNDLAQDQPHCHPIACKQGCGCCSGYPSAKLRLQVCYHKRKRNADMRPRHRGRFIKVTDPAYKQHAPTTSDCGKAADTPAPSMSAAPDANAPSLLPRTPHTSLFAKPPMALHTPQPSSLPPRQPPTLQLHAMPSPRPAMIPSPPAAAESVSPLPSTMAAPGVPLPSHLVPADGDSGALHGATSTGANRSMFPVKQEASQHVRLNDSMHCGAGLHFAGSPTAHAAGLKHIGPAPAGSFLQQLPASQQAAGPWHPTRAPEGSFLSAICSSSHPIPPAPHGAPLQIISNQPPEPPPFNLMLPDFMEGSPLEGLAQHPGHASALLECFPNLPGLPMTNIPMVGNGMQPYGDMRVADGFPMYSGLEAHDPMPSCLPCGPFWPYH